MFARSFIENILVNNHFELELDDLLRFEWREGLKALTLAKTEVLKKKMFEPEFFIET